MSDPAEQQPVDEAAELEAAVRQAIEACGGDPVDAVRALIVMNSALEQELRGGGGGCRSARTSGSADAGSSPGARRRGRG
nr:hypothetical protein [Bradyrhizobium australafricanum]